MFRPRKQYILVRDESDNNWGCIALLVVGLLPFFVVPALIVFLLCGGIFVIGNVGAELGLIPAPPQPALMLPTPIIAESEPIYIVWTVTPSTVMQPVAVVLPTETPTPTPALTSVPQATATTQPTGTSTLTATREPTATFTPESTPTETPTLTPISSVTLTPSPTIDATSTAFQNEAQEILTSYASMLSEFANLVTEANENPLIIASEEWVLRGALTIVLIKDLNEQIRNLPVPSMYEAAWSEMKTAANQYDLAMDAFASGIDNLDESKIFLAAEYMAQGKTAIERASALLPTD